MPEYLTKEGLEKLKEELHHLKKAERAEIARKLKEAASFGDLSENAEYAEAKEHQAFIEGRIQELENFIRDAVLIDSSKHSDQIAKIGSTIKVASAQGKETFIIVGAVEAFPQMNKISSESPLGQALIGKKRKEVIVLETPGGQKMEYKIIDIR